MSPASTEVRTSSKTDNRATCKTFFAFIKVISMYQSLHRAVSEARIRGLGSSEGGTRMRVRLSESPVSIRGAFPRPGAKHSRPKYARPESKQRMTSLRSPPGRMGLLDAWFSIRAGSMFRQETKRLLGLPPRERKIESGAKNKLSTSAERSHAHENLPSFARNSAVCCSRD
jgi:hypothetical protein